MADLGRAQQTIRLPSCDLPLTDWIKMYVMEAKQPPCITKNPANFSRFFLNLEAEQIMISGPGINLTDQCDNLLRFDKFNKIMDEDFFFYAVLFHRVILWKEVYSFTIDCRNKLIEKVIERLKSFPALKLVHIFKDSILPVVSDTGSIASNYVNVFPGMCELWLSICKREGKSLLQERYIYVAIACVTMSIKIATCQGKVCQGKVSNKYWTNLLVEPFKHIDLKEEALKDLSEGLQFMLECEVPPEHMVTLEHLQAMVSIGPNERVRSLTVARDFLETITSYCQLEHWGCDDFLTKFLRPLRSTYSKTGITFWTSRSRGGIKDMITQGASVVNIIDSGLQFILTVCRLLDGSNYGSSRDYDEECTKWIKLLLDLVDYNDATAPQCIKLFTDPQSKVFQYFRTNIIIPRLNIDLQNYLKKSIVDVSWFMEMYDSASDIWEQQVLHLFIGNKLPDNARLSDRGWKRFIQQFEKSYEGQALRQQQLLLPLLNSFAAQYQSGRRSFDMIVHFLQLDTPCLFMRIPSAGSDPSQHEPQQFRTFLRQFIHSNNLRKQFLDEYEILLENTSSSPNQFQVLIVSVMLEEIFKQHGRVRMTSQILSSALYVLTEADSNRFLDMKSARVRLVSGLLYHLSSYIHPNITDLKWLYDNFPDVCKLAQIYKLVARIESFRFVASVEDKSRLQHFGTSYPHDVLRFFEFILKVKKALRAWNSRILGKQVTFQNIMDLTLLVQSIADLADYLTLTDISISDDTLSRINDQHRDITVGLECVLVRRISDLSAEWCCLSKLLEKHDVGFDDVICDEIDKLVDMSLVCQQRTSIVKPQALVCDLQSLLQSLEEFLEPLQSCLDVLVFFELQQSNLFKCYLRNFLSSLLLCESQGLSLLPVTKEHLNTALNLTVDLIWKLCDGSATVQEVTLYDTLQLEDIDVEKEWENLSHFARIFSDRVSPKRSSSCEGLNGVIAVLELLKIYEDVFPICEVFKLFKLTKCYEDPDLVCLVKVAEELHSKDHRAQLTMDEAISKMALFREKLLNRRFFQLFKEVKNCKALFEFAEENGFAGEAGQKKFVACHNLVTTQLQHEDYSAVVLNHLLGCFDYINPFLSRPSSFNELMQLVTSLPNIENGIRQLRTVNQNIGLIKMWFSEKDTCENTTAGILKTIIKSRVICLRAANSDSVKLTLECDPDDSLTETTFEQPWSYEKLKGFATQVRFTQYEMQKQHQAYQVLKNRDIDGFLHIFEKAQVLKEIHQKLRKWVIRSHKVVLDLKIHCSIEYLSTVDCYVKEAQRDLDEWLESTLMHRQTCQWLVFFSNSKLQQLHNYLVKQPLQHIGYIVREISVIFPNDVPTRVTQATFIKKTIIEDLGEALLLLPAIQSAKVFLNKLMEYNDLHAPQKMMLVKQSGTVHGSVRLRHFTLYFIPGFTHKQQMQLLFSILQGAPLPFQLVQCTANTTAEELELLFQRMTLFSVHKYVIFNTFLLSSDNQEVLMKLCLNLLESIADSDTVTLPMLNFIETGHLVLRQMPWIFVNYEHKDQESLLATEHAMRKYFKSTRDKLNFKQIELVYGNPGDGKTHYIRKELAKGWHDETMTLSINECFNTLKVIKMLRRLPLEQQNFALFLNFTLPKPEAKEVTRKLQQDAARMQEESRQLVTEIHWFFFSLFIIGYIEDQSTGLSFRLPGGQQWSLFVEVPAWCHAAEQSLSLFNSVFPAFNYLGKVVHISPEAPFDTDGDIDVQLVCKYLKAKQNGKLDQWGYRNRMPYKIGKVVKDLKGVECQDVLRNCLPSNVTKQSKIVQRLYMKYLERRCKILEACPVLQFNEGIGECLNKDERKVTNIKFLRSLLFNTMEKEVANCCDLSLDQSHQQLIYDDAASFKFLSLQPDMISKEEKERFEDSGIEIPTMTKYFSRAYLDSCLSHALNVPLNDEGHISVIDEEQFVMTLDLLVKMINIHERQKCGIPVIISSETGVGKTCLLDMLAVLWNQSLLNALNKKKSSLIDLLITKLQCVSDLEKELQTAEGTCPVKRLVPADIVEVNSVLNALKDLHCTSLMFDSLLHVLDLSDPHEPSQALYQLFCYRLLEEQYDPLFALVVFPDNMPGDIDIMHLFERLALHDANATTRLLYGLFTGKPKKMFYKLCVHAALTVESITKFFEPVILEAGEILKWYNFCLIHESSNSCGTVATPPSLTVFLDYFNTASCPGFIKEIITDRTMNGKEIPPNVFIVAACNPHRINSLPGQTENVGSYVRPFHHTLEMLMWNYGSLCTVQEKEHIDSKMMVIEPGLELHEKRTFFSKLISKSQQLVRDYAAQYLREGNYSAEVVAVTTVSLRDIIYVRVIYNWLKQSFLVLRKYQENDESISLRALYVALAIVYYFRLNSTFRESFTEELHKFAPPDHWKVSVRFKTALTDELDWTISNMILPPGIATTEALKENVFATVVCTMTRIPLIIVGQPGSSKRLSFEIVINNLLGLHSPNAVFRNCEVFERLNPHFYQCSHNSTSTDLETVFQQAINRQANLRYLNMNSVSVVMMDEAGLSESNSQTVLHSFLDDQKVAFVGISNHILDAAITNKAVVLFRTACICQKDVEAVAKGCLLTYTEEPMKEKDVNYVRGFSHSYLDVIRNSHLNAFFSLKDFIHFCVYLRRSEEAFTPQLVMRSLERNFNGSKHFEIVSRYFLERVFQIGANTDKVKQQGVLDVLKESLADHPNNLSAVRYKLIIDSCKDGSLVRLLFSYGVLKRESTRIHMSSEFPGDAESELLGMVAAIKHSASKGHTVVLSLTDAVHKCFYDLLNQRFTCIEDSTHGKCFYANVVIGSCAKPALIHPYFQCVVVIKDSDLPHTQATFLSQFEKYSLSHQLLLSDLLNNFPPILRGLVNAAKDKVSQFLSCCGDSCLYGQNPDTLDSLLLTILPFHLPSTHAKSQRCSRRVNTKAAKLLAYLEWALQHYLGFMFSPSSPAELIAEGAHLVQMFLDNKALYADQLRDLAVADIPHVVDEALIYLKQDEELHMSANTELVTGLLQQWLVMYLCKRLLQLMTPEALVTNHEKLPNHYISHYFNQQSHFSLKDTIVRYYSNLWSPNVKGCASLVPNKLLCYCRSSAWLHNMPKEVVDVKEFLQHAIFVQDFIFPDIEKLQIFTITMSTTQKKLSQKLNSFIQKPYYKEILLLVVNVEEVSLDKINHIRVMIEEFEVPKLLSPKLFVLLLHFPPRLFFSQFYSSYFLHGWDHCYLDAAGPESTSTSINIQKWFSQCCTEPDTLVAPGSFMETGYLHNLLSEALPLVAPHISLKGCSDTELAANESLGTKLNVLNELLFIRGMDEIIFSHFSSYWTPSVMVAITEQASLLQKSALSITDTVNTMIKSNFYDFLFYFLSLMNDCQAIMIVIHSDVKSPIEELALSVVSKYPLPRNLSELKMLSIRTNMLCRRQHGLQPRLEFPFFHFVYDKVEELLNQLRRKLAVQKASADNEEQFSSDRNATHRNIYKTLVDGLKTLLSNKDDGSTVVLNAVFTAMECSGVWRKYVKDFCATKLCLGSELFTKSIESSLTVSAEGNIRCRVADLHVRVRLYHLDSECLSLMRFLDEMQKRYQAISEKQCLLGLFEKPADLFAVMIETTYKVLLTMWTSEQTCVNELKKLSSSYLQLMRLPTIRDTIVCKSSAVKTKWDIIHAAILMLSTEESLTEQSGRHVLEFILFLHVKITSTIPVLCLSKLIEYSLKHQHACSDDSKQQLLKGLMEHFFPPGGACDQEDVSWFLEQLMLNSDVSFSFFSRQPAAIRSLKLYLTRILTVNSVVGSTDTFNPMDMFDDKARENVGKVLLKSLKHQNGPFVPNFYMQCDAGVPENRRCLLADLYFSITLELTRRKALDLFYLIGLFKKISQKKSHSPWNYVLLEVEKQVLIHVLLEILAGELRLDNREIPQLLEVIDDINVILDDPRTGGGTDGRHGLMLTVHMLRRYRSVYFIHRLLVTHYDDLCRDFSCLHSLHSRLQEQKGMRSLSQSQQNDQFPFKLIHNRKCKEGSLYMKIKTELNIIHHTIVLKRRKESVTKFMDIVTSCYTVGVGGLKKYVFNMALVLFVYYEYYCQNVCSPVLAGIFQNELKHLLDRGLLNLLVCFVDRNCIQYHPEQTAAATGSPKAVDVLYSFFTQPLRASVEDIDPDSLAMQHTWVHLVAAIVGSPIEYTNLWYHLFSPKQLKGSHIPGFNSDAPCGASQEEVLYDVATQLSDDGFDLEHKHLLHTTRGTLNIFSRYFTLWANYSALCLSLLIDPTLADQLRGEVFSSGLPLRHYCFSRARKAWQLLSRNMNITVEERVQLVNQTIEHYYMKSEANSECLRDVYDSQGKVDECEIFIHEQCFVPAWRMVQQIRSDVYNALSTYYREDLRVLDTYYPKSATTKSFLLQILSSARLHDPTCELHILYQFVLKRPLFNAGGRLLPDLVEFYLWLHEEMAFCVLADDAEQLSIGVAMSTVLDSYSPAMRDRQYQKFNSIKKLYNSYDGRVGGRLEDSTKLIELLSVADEKLSRGNILYSTIVKIVDDFNKFLTLAVGHHSLRKMWRYFSNFKIAIPLDEVTVDACCFGANTSLVDLMPHVSKCCNQPNANTDPCDSSLLFGCVYDLLQLQEDIARHYLAGKQLLQSPSRIHRDFRFKVSPMTSLSDELFQCSVTDTRSLDYLHSMFKDDLESENLRKVKFEFHSFSYYTLLEVIIGLTSALNQLQKVLLEYCDREWEVLLDVTLAEFLKSHTGSLSVKGVLNISLSDAQWDCLENLRMRHVFKTLELLKKWMREGMFDFCVLPFYLKTELREEDRDMVHSIEKKAEGRAASVLSEIKFVTEQLVQCEGDFISASNELVEPILDVLRETAELTDEQMECLVMRHISTGVQVQHYVYLLLELRRLHKVFRNAAAKEKGFDCEATWNDWIEDTVVNTKSLAAQQTHGFGKWYEKSRETDLARQAAAQTSSEETIKEAVEQPDQRQWTPTTNVVNTASCTLWNTSVDEICSLPTSKSPEDRHELADLGNQYVDIVGFLKSIGLSEVAENVEVDGFTGDLIAENDEILKDIGMNAIDRLRFRVLFQRELLKQTIPAAVSFPVQKVVAFFKNKRILAKYAAAVEEIGLDGEMLLLCDSEAFRQLGVPAAGVKLINAQFRKLVLETIQTQPAP